MRTIVTPSEARDIKTIQGELDKAYDHIGTLLNELDSACGTARQAKVDAALRKARHQVNGPVPVDPERGAYYEALGLMYWLGAHEEKRKFAFQSWREFGQRLHEVTHVPWNP